MAMLIKRIVGELELEEGVTLLHPVAPWSWWVWVEVGPARRLRLCFSCNLPFVFIPLWRRAWWWVSLSLRNVIYRKTFIFLNFPQQSWQSWLIPPTETGGSTVSTQQGIEKQEEIVAFDVQCQGKRGVMMLVITLEYLHPKLLSLGRGHFLSRLWLTSSTRLTLYLKPSSGTMSTNKMYLAHGMRPDTLTLQCGNILLDNRWNNQNEKNGRHHLSNIKHLITLCYLTCLALWWSSLFQSHGRSSRAQRLQESSWCCPGDRHQGWQPWRWEGGRWSWSSSLENKILK